MKTSKYIVMALGLGLTTALSSCHMDLGPTDSIEVPDANNAITSELELTSMRNGVYQAFRSTFYGDNSQPSELMCDGFNATVDFANNYGPIHRTGPDFTSSDYDTQALWENMYSAIKDYNIFINSAQKFGEANAELKAKADLYEGEVLCMRAYSYMELVRHFAKAYNTTTASSDLGVPVIIAYDQTEKPHRATVAKVYEQIKADLDQAAAYGVANKSGAVRSEGVTADVLNMLYARYYLDTRNGAKAAEYAEKVINSAAGYQLAATPAAMKAEYTNDNGTEAIMQLPATITENGSGTNSAYTLFKYYAGFKNYPGKGVYTSPYFLPSQKLIDLYEDNDLRLGQWFQHSNYVLYLGGGGGWGSAYTFVKYEGNPELNSDGTPNARQHVKPFLLGEAYLIAAEAYLNAGNTAKAKEVLNALQAKRGATETEATDENIENEWFKETVGEGLRISCLKRWGKGYNGRTAQPGAIKGAMVYTGANYDQKSMPADDVHWVWPIPSYEIRVNPNLEGEQNPGY